MARFRIVVYKSTGKESHEVVGCKMTRRWIKNCFGERSREYTEGWDFYYVRKKNTYGIMWIIRNKNNYLEVGSSSDRMLNNTTSLSNFDYIVSKVA